MVRSAGTTLSAESFLPTEVGVPWKGSDPGTPTQDGMRVSHLLAAGASFMKKSRCQQRQKFATNLVD